jgi:hypothetical protein
MKTVDRSRARSRRGSRSVALVCLVVLVAAGCSGGDGDSGESASATTTTQARPAGPRADLSRELSGGNGVFIGSPAPEDLEQDGYVEEEYEAAGTATAYTADGEPGEDGRWTFEPDVSAPYTTRVLVRRPADPGAFSGNVIVEWLNVSGGVDANPDWMSMREEILRRGDAWVGVSAQSIGVEGGPVLVRVDVPGAEAAGEGLKKIDPARYGELEHPGDAFSFDIYTQVARAVRTGSGLSGLEPKKVIAVGESQSAFALVTYYNGVQPLTQAFDGFLVHSRGGAGLPLVAPGESAGIAGAIGGSPTIFRTDQDAPVMDVQAENDVVSVLSSYAARQPDSDRFRLWEVAGTSHADQHLLGPTVEYIDCGVEINDGPLHLVVKAALRALTTWIETGTAPPDAPRLDVVADPAPVVQRDGDGIALGGIRTPPVDVPVVVLSGEAGPVPSTICLLNGSTKPLAADRIAELHPSRAAYLEDYEADADATIEAGFVLPEDRAALLDYARPELVAG